MSKLRPEIRYGGEASHTATNGTAYLMVYTALERQGGLIHGKLHDRGMHCAIGSFWDANPRVALYDSFIDEVAAVNDSVPHKSAKQRKAYVKRWLRWKLAQCGMPGFKNAAKP